MADLIAIGYDDEATAAKAATDVGRVEHDLLIEPDAVAVIVRDGDGSYHLQTNHHAVSGTSTYGMIWGALFGLLLFIPVFGMAVGAGLGALIGKVETTADRSCSSGTAFATCSSRARPHSSSSSRKWRPTRRSRR